MVARMHRFSVKHKPHEHYFSELQLYRPFRSENELHPDNLEACKDLYEEKSLYNDRKKISNIKQLLMKYLEEVEVGTERAQEVMETNAGIILDPLNEQDNAECQEDIEDNANHGLVFLEDTDTDTNKSNLAKSIRRIDDSSSFLLA